MSNSYTLNFHCANTSYDIVFGLLDDVGEYVLKKCLPTRAFLVTDDNVHKLYAKRVQASFEKLSIPTLICSIGGGESQKSLDTVKTLYEQMYAFSLGRNDCIVAVGGGVVGDIAGFAAATYMRGIQLIQIPTTVIAQADSAYGGKCGVNFAGNKNMIGAFYQPTLVLADIDTLETLNEREKRAGFAEIIKCGCIGSLPLFERLESADETIGYYIKESCAVKKRFVELDEYDMGLRHTLNFGHTFGHAVESAGNGKILHGEAVAQGMALAAKLGEKMGITCADAVQRLNSVLAQYGLSTELGESKEWCSRLIADKKRVGNNVDVVLLEEIGKAKIISVPFEELNWW